MSGSERFSFGDRVRHVRRPEWGVGSVMRAESLPVNGQAAQRLSVRFSGVGVKTLNTAHAPLELVDPSTEAVPQNGEADDEGLWDRLRDEDWLAPVVQRKVEKIMTALPEGIRDPFNGMRHRVAAMLDLYRFDRSGRGLMDWAVAQTGLEDPLAYFNRHELEQYFDRWVTVRDAQLSRLLQEAASAGEKVDDLVRKALPSARTAARRVGAGR